MGLGNIHYIRLRIIHPLERETRKHIHVRIAAKQPQPVTNNDGNVATPAKQARIHFQPGVQQVTQEGRYLIQSV